MIKMKKKDFDSLVESIAQSLYEDYDPSILQLDSPKIMNEPPLDRMPVEIDPKSDLQVSDERLPIDDSSWIPGNNTELGMAMKQMAEIVPESQIEWFYTKLRRLIDSSIDQEDEARMRPRLG